MSNWYSVKPYNTTGGNFASATGGLLLSDSAIYPCIVNGVEYDKSNLTTIRFIGDKDNATSTTYVPIAIAFYTSPSNITPWVYKSEYLRGGFNGYGHYGFPLILQTKSTITNSYFTLLEKTTIAGKYKIPQALTQSYNALLSMGTININYSIGENNYRAFCFTDGYNWFNTFNGVYTHRANTIIGGYNTPVNLGETPPDFTIFNISNTSPNIKSDYAGKILDFGDTPQEVPKLFADFINDNFEAIYPYSYTIKNYDGDVVLSEITDAPPMVSASLSTVGNQKILRLTGVNNREYELTWVSDTPTGEIFLGLANNPKSNRPAIVTGTTIGVSWTGYLTFYESYGTYRPPATTFDINLYQNSAEVNRVDKGQFLVGVGTLSGALREECSMLTPSIVYQSSDVPTFNYVYIPIFNRYYYVTSLSSVSKNVWRMELNCDVLMTYKEQIYLLQGVIGRQEVDFNPLLVDNELPTQNNPIVEVIDITSDAFNTQISDAVHNYVITVIGA